MNIFGSNSYKEILQIGLKRLQARGRAANMTGLANACGVQRSYVSRVFNQDGQFSSDQLYLACKYLRFSAPETNFTAMIFEGERTQLLERKLAISKNVEKLRLKASSTERHITATPEVHDMKRELYYLDPLTQIIHVFMSIDKYADNPDLIKNALSITADELRKSLDSLIDAQLIYRESKRWIVPSPSSHLSSDSSIYPAYRLLMRVKALEKLLRNDRERDYSFSAVISADKKTRALIQEEFLKFLKMIEPIVQRASSENVYQINFDLLTWGSN